MSNALVIGDTHIPFHRRGYLQFCQRTAEKYDCTSFYHVGDLVDNHAINMHEHDPDGLASGLEIARTKCELRRWVKAFPKMHVCIGNHDDLPRRRAVKHGISQEYIKSLDSVFELPDTWVFADVHRFGNTLIMHGTGYGGEYAHRRASLNETCSVVLGHLHSNAGVLWTANRSRLIYGLAVGCGADQKSYAFNYSKYHRRKFMLGCGVINREGTLAQFIPMRLK